MLLPDFIHWSLKTVPRAVRQSAGARRKGLIFQEERKNPGKSGESVNAPQKRGQTEFPPAPFSTDSAARDQADSRSYNHGNSVCPLFSNSVCPLFGAYENR